MKFEGQTKEEFFEEKGFKRERYSDSEIQEINQETKDLQRLYKEYGEQLDSMEPGSGPYEVIDKKRKEVNEKIQQNLERVQQDTKLN